MQRESGKIPCSLRIVYIAVQNAHHKLPLNMALRLEIKAFDDAIGLVGIVPSLLVIGVILVLPVINKPLPKQRECVCTGFGACRRETLAAELRFLKQ